MSRKLRLYLADENEKKENKEFINTIINNKDREAAGEAVAAKGLFLYKVKY